MRQLLFLLITLLSGSALDALPTPFQILGPVKQVPPQCVDPTYACQDLENARQCQVVKSCINDIWATMSAPEDNEDICSLCKEMVKEARDQLLSNMTQEELKEVFEGSCKLLGVKAIVDGCIKLVDDFIPDLVEMLASRMDPNMVCTVAGLCNMAHLPIEEHLRNFLNLAVLSVNSDNCDQCTTAVFEIKNLTASMTEPEFCDVITDLCAQVTDPSICAMVVSSIAESIYEFITSCDPKTVCVKAKMCPSVKHIIKVPIENKKVNDDLVCQFCTNVLEHIKEEIIANTTMEEFKTALLNFCTHLGSFSDKCTSLVNDYYDMLFDYLKKLDTKGVCTFIGLCQSGMDCSNISPLVKLYPAETLPKHPKTPSLPTKTKIYSQPMVKLVPAKEMSKKDFRNAADIETNEIFGSAAESALPIERLAMPLITIDRDLDCPFCKAVTFFLDKDLKGDRSRDGVSTAMNNVCGKWVKEYPEECESFLEKYSVHVKNHIFENGDFDVLCTHIRACPLLEKDTGVDVKVINPTPPPAGEICDLCRQFFDEVEKLIKDPSLQQSVKQFLQQGCQLCPAKQKCIDFVEKNVNQLLAVIEKNLQSSVACPALHLCPAGTKNFPHLPSLKNIECDLCKNFIQQVADTLQDPQTKAYVQSTLEKGCGLLPQEFSTQCKTLVDENIDGIIQMLISWLNPDVICATLKICPDSAKVVKPPKSNDLECELCKEMVEKLEDHIKDPKTEGIIKGDLEKICTYLPSEIQDKCKTMIESYTGDLITFILQEWDAGAICAFLNFCPEPKKVVKPPKNNDLECDLCKEIIKKVEDEIKDQKTEDAIKKALEKVCTYIPSSMQDKCTAIIEEYTDLLIELLMQEMDPDKICAALKLCPESKKVAKPPKSDLDCDLCKKIVDIVETELKDKKTEDKIRDALDEFCSILPSSLRSRCTNFVDKYFQLLMSIVLEEMDPTLVCATFGACPTQDLECEACQSVLHYIQQQLADNDTQSELKNVLKRVCDLLPKTYADNCDAFVDEYGAAFFVLIAQELDPSVICPKLKMCPSVKKHLNKVLQQTNIKSVSIDKCKMCTIVVDYMDKLLEDDDVDKEITALVEKVCVIVPSSVKNECSAVIETYSPYILQMIGQIAGSKQVCQEIDMCSRTPGHVHLLGEKKCTFGPSYWCQSKAHAAACKAENYCNQKVWKN